MCPSGELFRFSTISMEWTWLDEEADVTGAWPSARSNHALAAVGADMYIFGGTTDSGSSGEMFRYSTISMEWTALDADAVTGKWPNARSNHALAAVGTDIYLFGGSTFSGSSGELFRYSTISMEWARLDAAAGVTGTLPGARSRHALAAVGTDIYLFGGMTDSVRSGELFRYSTISMEWTTLDTTARITGTWPSARDCHALASVEMEIYLFGGSTFSGSSGELFRYSTISMEWARLDAAAGVTGTWPSARLSHALAAVGTDIYLFGGMTDSGSSGELFRYSTISMEWARLADVSARWSHALAAVGTEIYLFGGSTDSGSSGELFKLFLPAVHAWPSFGLTSFTRIYDDDIVRVTEGVSWDWSADLCSRAWLPCSLTIVGVPSSPYTIRRRINSRISCDAGMGCSGIALIDIKVMCSNRSVSAALQVSGASLKIVDSSFINCSAVEDGGSIRVFDGAVLNVTSSSFVRSSSMKNGGALAIVGATAYISDSSFEDCSAVSGLGGAVWTNGFPRYPLPLLLSMIHLSNCKFSRNTAKSGGSLAMSSTEASVARCAFDRNSASQSGGAMSMSESARASISASTFTANSAAQAGGAVSMSSATTDISGSNFIENQALALGGGALHAAESALELLANAFVHNSALEGGGGVLLWHGVPPVIRMACDLGKFAEAKNSETETHSCAPCPPGSFKDSIGAADCTLCAAGKYGTASGAQSESSCSECPAGMFQNETGASSCKACPAHSNSSVGSVACQCDAGYFGDGTSSCEACTDNADSPPGSTDQSACICTAGYFGNGRSSCEACVPGKFRPGTCVNKDSPESGWQGICSYLEATGGAECVSLGVPEDLCCICTGAQEECLSCPAGWYAEEAGASACSPCPAGTFQSERGASNSSSCASCPDNADSPPGSTGSCFCRAGYFGDGTSSCEACVPGKFLHPGTCVNKDSPESGWQGVCSYLEATGGAECVSLGVPEDLCCICTGAQECLSCPAGSYAEEAGASACSLCPAGTFQNETGASSASSCASCPDNADSPPGSTDISSCFCRAGYFGNGTSSCEACVPGKFHPGICVNKDTAESGWWGVCSYVEIGITNGMFEDCAMAISEIGFPADMCCICVDEAKECSSCSAGSYAEEAGASACSLCPAGTFQNETGALSCTACSGDADSAPGSTGASACSPSGSGSRQLLIPESGGKRANDSEIQDGARSEYVRGSKMRPQTSTRDTANRDPSASHDFEREHVLLENGKKSRERNSAGANPGRLSSTTLADRLEVEKAITGPSHRRYSGEPRHRHLLSSDTSSPTSLSNALPADHTLAEYTHWLCGRGSAKVHNNTAGYGGCVATLFSSLELSGVPDRNSPAFAGVDFQLTVLKRDLYGQLMASDDSSLLQLYSALDGERVNDDSLSFLGSVFSGIKSGRAVFSIAVKPTFSHVSEQQGISHLLRRVYIYVEGQDAASGATMRSDPRMVHMVSGNLSACPVGDVLVLDTTPIPSGGSGGTCVRCAAGKYNVNPLTGKCLACPPSALCTEGAPPLFAASRVTAFLAMELPAGGRKEAIRETLASKLGLQLWQVSILKMRQQDRRSVQQVEFEIVADRSQLDKLASQAEDIGLELGDTEALSASAEGEVWEESGGQFYLKKCPPGHRLINTTEPEVLAARCASCLPTTYIIDPLGPCVDCPVGASCPDGIRFVPHAVGSVWDEVRVTNADKTRQLVKRIVECPAGHALEFNEALPINDNCRPCEPNTYRLDPSVRNSSFKGCIPCHPRATCPGMDVIEAVKGYWRVAPILWDDFYEYLPGAACRMEGSPCLFPSEGFVPLQRWKEEQMTCSFLPGAGDDLFCARPIQRRVGAATSVDSNISRVHIVRCPTGACASNNTCLANRTGPGAMSACSTCYVGSYSFILLATALSFSRMHSLHHYPGRREDCLIITRMTKHDTCNYVEGTHLELYQPSTLRPASLDRI